MKKMNFKLVALAVTTLLIFPACGDNNDPKVPNVVASDHLIGELTENRTLEAGSTYYLTGGYHVKKGVTLTIKEGVTIISKDDNISDYILIEQGAKINAIGTAEKPIVMSAERKERGAWGGVHICGKSKINVTGGTSKSEIGDAIYGGDDDTDNSGVLRYIRLEYTGYAISEDKESNGFTFYGVGSGTTAEYLQAYKGADDGFEWFGGTVNVKYLISTDSGDDSFDWTYGWRGKGQFMVAYQNENQICDCLIEADNNSKNSVATPTSFPTLSNLTLIGNGSADNINGVKFRRGTNIKLYNALIKGKERDIRVESDETENSLKDGVSILDNIYLSTVFSSEKNIYTEGMFTAASGNKINQSITFTGKFIGTIAGGNDLSSLDNFFMSTDYIGAVSVANDWTKGWSR